MIISGYVLMLSRALRGSLGNAPSGGGGGVLPYERLMGTCRWMGSHFHDWIDNNGVAFSIELLECGHKSSNFWGK